MKRNTLLILGIILTAGFLLRIAYLVSFSRTAFFDPVLMDKHDQKTFHIWAQQILESPWRVQGEPFYMAPLYAYWLALMYLLLSSNLFLVCLAQMLMDVGTCLLLFYLGKRLADERAGLIAAFLGCFYRTFIVYAGTILSDSLILFLYTAFIASVYHAIGKPGLRRWVLCGIVLGLAALAKPTIAIFLPFLLAGLLLHPEASSEPAGPVACRLCRRVPERVRRVLPSFLTVVIVSGLVILPVTIRNFSVSGQFVPICTNGPVNWQIGNSADSLGLFCYPQGPLLSPLSAAFWRLFGRKILLFFSSYEWPQNLNVYLMDRIVPALSIAFVRFNPVVPAGLAGLAVLMRTSWRKNFLFVSFAVTNALWVALFFVTDRYRLPAVACFTVSAACLAAWSVDRLRSRSPRALLAVIVAWLSAAAISYVSSGDNIERLPGPSLQIFYRISWKSILRDVENRNLALAKIKAEQLVGVLRGDAGAHVLLAAVCADMGDFSRARSLLQRALTIDPGCRPARDFLNSIP